MSAKSSTTDVIVIGAGPNGIGLAAAFEARGVDHRIFGHPMQTWLDMPATMNLKSLGFATSIPLPGGHPTFPEYCQGRGLEDYEPIEFATFAQYGLEVQQAQVPYVETVKIRSVKRRGGGFVVETETGEQIEARRVIVAVGLSYFKHIPDELKGLPAERLSHTWGKTDFASFANQDVVVIGGGSSALESATLLAEHGANVTLLARNEVYWGERTPPDAERTLREKIKLPVTSLGHGRENWVLQHAPGLMFHVPAKKRLPFTARHLGPFPAWWLRERVEGRFPIQSGVVIRGSRMEGDRVVLTVADASGTRDIKAQRVVAGTGYRFDLDRIAFIDRGLAASITRWDEHAPRLDRHFQSSVPGLYFVGPIAAPSFGPLVRFVAGAPFTVGRVAKHVARTKQGSRVPSAMPLRAVSATAAAVANGSGSNAHDPAATVGVQEGSSVAS